MKAASCTLFTGVTLALAAGGAAPSTANPVDEATRLSATAALAQEKLQQTFTNLKFEDFALAPIEGPIYQAVAGGKVIYYAPESEVILFAAVYDKNGVNLTALSQDATARRKIDAIDPSRALAIGPREAPTVIEFTDPDCPYCQALDRFWAAKAAEGKPVRRLVFFVSEIHPEAAAKAEHILCSADPAAEFKAIYSGGAPNNLRKCDAGAAKVRSDNDAVHRMGISGTPTVIANGKVITGFQQAELTEFLERPRQASNDADERPASANSN